MTVKKVLVTFLCLGIVFSSFAQLKSPASFLGYEPGARLTPHWKIVSYFHHVAANAFSMVKVEEYGQTNEGRPLLVAFISSPSNISSLEQIRQNNLRLANVALDKAAPLEQNAPAIIWLSYNVHGNESSSSEAAMKTLFSLVDPANAETKEWLKNTVIVIDPCVNPDGRDRYVNWYNSIVGKRPNPLLISREHREPWPGGRTNHYNFDLNRDWAWQTQVESRQRIEVYNRWLPQVHVDYHEQWHDSPYYFAPAAEPFHEVITPWQRSFQETIGRNNAKYFDRNGWLYYTKEFFDLFYPSYGDTYPTFNGAIGMTYEQGGHGMAGTAVLNKDGDTLTLNDRVLHHHTTALSTIEISSQNASSLVREFRKYFQDALSTGIGEYKTYVVKNNPADEERIKSLVRLYNVNGIRFNLATVTGSYKGFNYATGKDETFAVSAGDIIVSALQPRSAMVKVLMEPRSKLPDSLTYDISAWSIPYAYGLTAWATRDKINGSGSWQEPAIQQPETTYGYVMEWKGVNSARTAGQLLQEGIMLRFSEEPFEINGKKFGRGSVIILKTTNKAAGNTLWSTVRRIATENKVQLHAVSGGMVDKGFDFGSYRVRAIKAPKVVMLTGEGVNGNAAGEIWHFFEQELDYPLTLVNTNNAGGINWNEVNVLILPDGNYRLLSDKSSLEDLKNWISKGGRVIAFGNAVSQLAKADIGIKEKSSGSDSKDTVGNYSDLKKFANRDRDAVVDYTPGSIFRVDMDNSHPLAFGYPNYYYTLKTDDQLYEFIKSGGWNVGVIKRDNQVAGFIGAGKKDKFRDGLLFGVLSMGEGSVTIMADNPLFRSFWENGKLMLCNAVFLSGQ